MYFIGVDEPPACFRWPVPAGRMRLGPAAGAKDSRAMDYTRIFSDAIGRLKAEGPLPRLRRPGAALRRFPARDLARPERRRRGHRVVLERLSRHGPAPEGAGRDEARRSSAAAPVPAARATSPAPTTTTCCWKRELADLHGKEAALVFTLRLQRQRGGAEHLGKLMPGCHHLFRRAQPRLDDRRHPPQRLREARSSRHNDVADLERRLRAADPGAPEADRLRIGLLDGRRHRAASREFCDAGATATAR